MPRFGVVSTQRGAQFREGYFTRGTTHTVASIEAEETLCGLTVYDLHPFYRFDFTQGGAGRCPECVQCVEKALSDQDGSSSPRG